VIEQEIGSALFKTRKLLKKTEKNLKTRSCCPSWSNTNLSRKKVAVTTQYRFLVDFGLRWGSLTPRVSRRLHEMMMTNTSQQQLMMLAAAACVRLRRAAARRKQ